MLNACSTQLDGERKRRASAVQTLSRSEQDLTVARKKLQVEEEARKSAELASEGYQKQAEEQTKLLHEANAELKKTQEQVLVLKKHLEETQKLREQAEKLKEQAEQKGYELGIAETEKALRAEVPEVCRIFCARTWNEALNRAGVEASSELRKPENVYYPEAIRSSAPQSYQADTPSPAINPPIEEVPSRNSPNKPTTASKSEATSHDFQQELDSTVQSTGGITN